MFLSATSDFIIVFKKNISYFGPLLSKQTSPHNISYTVSISASSQQQSVEEIQIRLEWQNYIITTQGCCNEEWIFKAMFPCASLLWNECFLSSILSPADCRHKTKGWRGRRHNSNWIMHWQLARVESYFPPWHRPLIRNQIQVKEESQSIQKSLSHRTYINILILSPDLLLCVPQKYAMNT